MSFGTGSSAKRLLRAVDELISQGIENPNLEADLRELRRQIEEAERNRQWRKIATLAINLAHWLSEYLNL